MCNRLLNWVGLLASYSYKCYFDVITSYVTTSFTNTATTTSYTSTHTTTISATDCFGFM